MRPKYLILFLKEMKESLRDRRALSLMVVLALMYPLMYWLLISKLIDGAHRLEKKGADVVIVGDGRVPGLTDQLAQRHFRVKESGTLNQKEISNLLERDAVTAVVRVSGTAEDQSQGGRIASIELWYDSSSENGENVQVIESIVRETNDRIVKDRVIAQQLPSTFTEPIAVKKNDLASNASRSARYLGAMLGFLFLPVFILCMSTVLDSTAGERERRSLEILLAQPIKAYEIIVGKWLAAAVYSIVGVTLELILVHVIFKYMPLHEIDLAWRLTTADILFVCIATIPLSFFAAALEILLAMNSKSLKEAQSIVGIVAMLPLFPALAATFVDVKGALWVYAVPVMGNLTLLRELARGEGLGIAPYILTAIVPLFLSIVAIYVASQRMKSEQYVINI